MRARLIGGATATTFLLCSPAWAQSTVTLYGLLDSGFTYSNNQNGKASYQASSGELQGSRFGLRGVEDLGGGMKAIFTIENGFDGFTGRLGQGGLGFGRQAYVGLSSPYGTITVGRQYESIVEYLGYMEAGDTFAGYLGAHAGDVDNFNNTFRVNNSVRYKSPNFNGFDFGGLYSFGGTPGDFANNRVWSVGAEYVASGLTLAGAFLSIHNASTNIYGASAPATAGAAFESNVKNPIYSGFTSASTVQIAGVAARYASGKSTIGAMYSQTRFGDVVPTSAGPYSGNLYIRNVEVSYQYFITSLLEAGAAYVFTKAPDAKYHQVSLGLDYFLSKRTDVYGAFLWQRAIGTDSTGNAAVANLNLLSPSSSANQLAVHVALRHKF
ncbi:MULTISPECIES: porin [Burkholderia]|uniref:Porin n=2 Tax=Burkholderia humptydooensis TaxID=430531 RepID=A0A7U4STU4_9BURK|nr:MULTISPECIES: porin [Burkholderia]AGK46681.1 gram-negative porin family protein [Burkholderia thailandensis MSMB121]ATF35256.1 porin [Burkholderia thailandensis]AJY41713.1 gram-negative porin family protein [Burkholderia sp. 2002721687]ALX44132.1 porin [Burkholderia humptydooensis]EIP89478.1 outer membrane porin OpcP [Burkholderia humptydooensis MSMB43]